MAMEVHCMSKNKGMPIKGLSLGVGCRYEIDLSFVLKISPYNAGVLPVWANEIVPLQICSRTNFRKLKSFFFCLISKQPVLSFSYGKGYNKVGVVTKRQNQ